MHHLTWSSFRIKAYEKRAKRYHPGTVCRSFRQQRSIAAGEQRIKAAGAVRNLMGRAHCSHPCATGRKNGLSGRAVPNPDGQGRPLRHTSYPFPLFSESLNAKKRFEGSKATCGHASTAAGNVLPSVPAKENNIRIGHGASATAASISKKKKKKNSRPQEDQYSSFPVPGENRRDRVPITQDRIYRKISPSADTRLTAA